MAVQRRAKNLIEEIEIEISSYLPPGASFEELELSRVQRCVRLKLHRYVGSPWLVLRCCSGLSPLETGFHSSSF
jgi:hypothetical protein